MTESDDSPDFVLDLAVLVGVLADVTRVPRGRDAFSVDFLRDIPEAPRPVLVARALVPPVVAFELRDQLEEALGSYTVSGAFPRTPMIDGVPLPEDGILRKGVIHRLPAPATPARRPLDPDVLEDDPTSRTDQDP